MVIFSENPRISLPVNMSPKVSILKEEVLKQLSVSGGFLQEVNVKVS